jgi:hypothetical protein
MGEFILLVEISGSVAAAYGPYTQQTGEQALQTYTSGQFGPEGNIIGTIAAASLVPLLPPSNLPQSNQ